MTIALEQAELKSLADLCARRFADAPTRARFAAQAGVDVEVTDPGDALRAWSVILEQAQAQGRVSQLVDVMAQAAPDDEILREVAGVFHPAPRDNPLRIVLAGAATALVLCGVAFFFWPSGPHAPTATPTGRTNAAAAPVDAAKDRSAPPATIAGPVIPTATPAATTEPIRPSEPAPTAEAKLTAAPSDRDASAAEKAEKAEAAAKAEKAEKAEAAAKAAQAAAEPAVSGAANTTRCGGASGLAGYWYAGDVSPGEAGATITLPSAVRVRAAYPHNGNGHNAKSDIRCVLQAGTQVTLSQAPIHVAGDKWWVPYVVR